MPKANPLGIGMNVKSLFFDRKAVINRLDPKKRRFLSKFGAFVRTRARGSIRPGGKSGKVSEPGNPPRYHTGLIRKIFFAFDPKVESVVIGPVILNAKSSPGALQALEYGGTVIGRRIEITEKRDSRGRFEKHEKNIGGKVKSTIEARPFMTPAFEAEKKNISSIWKQV